MLERGPPAPRGVSLYPAASCPGEPTQTRLCDGKPFGTPAASPPKTQPAIQLPSPRPIQGALLLTQKVAFISGFLKPAVQKEKKKEELNIRLRARLCVWLHPHPNGAFPGGWVAQDGSSHSKDVFLAWIAPKGSVGAGAGSRGGGRGVTKGKPAAASPSLPRM